MSYGSTGPLARYRVRPVTVGIMLHATKSTPTGHPEATIHAASVGARRLGLLEIGWHFIITPDGTTLDCRPHNAIGAHHRPSNKTHIAVALEGDAEFTEEQRVSFHHIWQWLEDRYGISLEVTRHNADCPKIEDMAAWLTRP